MGDLERASTEHQSYPSLREACAFGWEVTSQGPPQVLTLGRSISIHETLRNASTTSMKAEVQGCLMGACARLAVGILLFRRP